MPLYHATAKRSARNNNTAVLTGFAESPPDSRPGQSFCAANAGTASAIDYGQTLPAILPPPSSGSPPMASWLRSASMKATRRFVGLRDQPLRDGIRSSFAELHVVRVVAAGVGVTFDAEFGDPRRPQMLVNQLENGVALWLQGRLVFVEHHGSRQFETVVFEDLKHFFCNCEFNAAGTKACCYCWPAVGRVSGSTESIGTAVEGVDVGRAAGAPQPKTRKHKKWLFATKRQRTLSPQRRSEAPATAGRPAVRMARACAGSKALSAMRRVCEG